MAEAVPDPMHDPEGYALWCEMHACSVCQGTGEVDGDDDLPRTCRRCDGSGIDLGPEGEPSADEGDYDDE